LDVLVTVRAEVPAGDWPGTYFLIQDCNWAFHGRQAGPARQEQLLVEKATQTVPYMEPEPEKWQEPERKIPGEPEAEKREEPAPA
jgi:hypothetical protein